jgi:hypothetical protein
MSKMNELCRLASTGTLIRVDSNTTVRVCLKRKKSQKIIKKIKALLKTGLDINEPNDATYMDLSRIVIWTPLQWALTSGNIHIAEFLLAKGANPLIINKGTHWMDGGNLLHSLCHSSAFLGRWRDSPKAQRKMVEGYVRVIGLLKEAGVDPKEKSTWGNSCREILDDKFHQSKYNCHVSEMLKTLLL